LVDVDGWKVKKVCLAYSISRKTYYEWRKKDLGLGVPGRRPRKPHPQLKIVGSLRVFIVDAKRKYNFGPKKMSVYVLRERGVRVSPSAIYKFYKRRGLIRRPVKRQAWYTPMTKPFRASIPGENVQLDLKYVPGRDGLWRFQYRLIDTVTNMQHVIEKKDRTARTTIKVLESARRTYPFKIAGIQTDNGGEFRGVFHTFLRAEGIEHRYIPRRSAPWNGKVERANRSVDDEYYLNPGRPWKTVRAYTDWYNTDRPHDGKDMDGLTPYQKYLTFTQEKCHP
jgi:transposase